jgi:hypothetical protein
MTTIQAVIFGMMLVLTSSLVLLALFIWREGIGLSVDDETIGERFHSSHR